MDSCVGGNVWEGESILKEPGPQHVFLAVGIPFLTAICLPFSLKEHPISFPMPFNICVFGLLPI